MHLTKLNEVNTLNREELDFIHGGARLVINSENWSDSTSRDCKKKDISEVTDSKKKDSPAIQ